MATVTQEQPKDLYELTLEETERRLDSYYEVVRPGEEDSPISPLTLKKLWPIIIIGIALTVLWLIGRFVITPTYY